MTKVWKFVVAIVLVCALALAGMAIRTQTSAGKSGVKTPDQFRAVWVATVYRLDYPSQATTDPAVLKRDADAILQECVELGMNAVILQVRPSADALYPSDYYPWSRYLTGTQGTAPRNSFDPLEYWVERAHALGLELHAWINPFRITKSGRGAGPHAVPRGSTPSGWWSARATTTWTPACPRCGSGDPGRRGAGQKL